MNKLIILISFFLISCNNQEMIIKFKNHSGIGTFSRGENEGKNFYYQSIIVKSSSDEIESIKNELLDYHSKSIDSIFQEESTIQFSSTFYKENSKTSYFITNNDDPGGISSEILTDYYDQYGLAEVVTKRIKNSKEYTTEISFAK